MNSSRLIVLVLFLLAFGYRDTNPDSSGSSDRNSPLVSKDTVGWPATFGFGRPATQKEIDAWDISIRPDGNGLPAGSGDVATGLGIYRVKCAACHGKTGIEGPYARLVAAMDDTTKTKAIGNYWPYATTLFDYTRRAMPYNAPGSLSADEVYSLTAFLLHVNKIIDSNTVMTAESLPKVVMPARILFVPDDRKGGPEIR
jgi:S-disulfanyl-L-cysteine oxidoreductase SoxD